MFVHENPRERAHALRLAATLKDFGDGVWKLFLTRTLVDRAEGYHQDYYETIHAEPYCHGYTPRFP